MFQDPWFYTSLASLSVAALGWLLTGHFAHKHAELWLAVKAEMTDRAKAEKVKQAQAQQQAKQAPAKPLDIHIGGHKVASIHMPAAVRVGE